MTSTTCRPWSRATSTRARARSRERRRSSRRRSSASRAGSASSTCCRRSARCANTARRWSSRCSPRTTGRWESASPRDLARVEAIARAVMSRLLHEPTIRLRSLSGERGHASIELVRELFGLSDEEPDARAATAADMARGATTCASSRAARAPAARAPLTRRTRALMRIGTRGSALALAQAELVADRLAPVGGAPRSSRSTTERRQRGGASAATSRAGWTRSRRPCWPARSTSPCTPPRTSRASWRRRPGRCWGARARARPRVEDVLCGARAPSDWTLPRGRARRHEQHPPGGPAAGRSRGPRGRGARRQRRHAPAQARRGEPRRDRARPGRPAALGREEEIGAVLDPARFVPAPGQGALALEARAGDERVREAVATILDADTSACLRAERAAREGARRELPHPARRLRGARGLRLPAAARLGRPARRLGLGRATSCSAASTSRRRSATRGRAHAAAGAESCSRSARRARGSEMPDGRRRGEMAAVAGADAAEPPSAACISSAPAPATPAC